jgi:hypothetical protein
LQAGEEEVAGWLGEEELAAFMEKKKLQWRSGGCNGDLEELQAGRKKDLEEEERKRRDLGRERAVCRRKGKGTVGRWDGGPRLLILSGFGSFNWSIRSWGSAFLFWSGLVGGAGPLSFFGALAGWNQRANVCSLDPSFF